MTLAELLSGAGYVLDTPGALLRGGVGNIVDLISGQDRTGWRASGREMLEAIGALGANKSGLDAGDVAGFLAEVLLDPLNLVPFGAAYKGGKRLATLADKAGPRWTHAADATEVLGSAEKWGLDHWAGNKDILSYIPTGSKPIGEGSEAIAFKSPAGRVIRLARSQDDLLDPQSRYIFDALLQPSRSTLVPSLTKSGPGGYRSGTIVENLPLVRPLDSFLRDIADSRLSRYRSGSLSGPRLDEYLKASEDSMPLTSTAQYWHSLSRPDTGESVNHWMPRDAVESSIIDDVYASGDHIMDRLYKSARKAGVRWGDPHFGNAAIAGGRPKILDPGFMDSAASLGEDVAEIPRAPLGEHIRQSAVVNRLADALGYTGMVRNQWEGLPWRDPTLRNAFLAAPSAGFLNALHGQY